MKKQAMSLAVTAALLGGAVSATGQNASMSINEGGLGETLIYPFYSAANGNDTYVHIVNTTDNTKAVKVRFIEAENSAEVLDFNLYLSPRDEWAGVITANPLLGVGVTDGAIIRTVDNSCTVPALGTGATGTQSIREDGTIVRDQAFVNFEYVADGDIVTSLSRTRQGYVEIIEMGQLDPTFGYGADAVHDSSGVPADCAALVAAWTRPVNAAVTPPRGAWITNENDELLTTWDGGGLYGYSVLINVDEGTAFGIDATAIANFANSVGGALPDPSLHSEPGDILPGLTSGTAFATVYNAETGVATPYEMIDGEDAVSALFMTDVIINDYVVDPGINAMTDWIINFPTKRGYTQTIASPPFSSFWGPNTAGTADEACEPISMFFWDREEAFEIPPTDGPVFSPQPPGETGSNLQLCKEVNVITFGKDSAVQATDSIRYGLNDILEYTQGWSILDFTGTSLVFPAGEGLPTGARELSDFSGANTFIGLPATGFAVFEYTNGQIVDPVDGIVRANYEAAVPHKTVTTVLVGP